MGSELAGKCVGYTDNRIFYSHLALASFCQMSSPWRKPRRACSPVRNGRLLSVDVAVRRATVAFFSWIPATGMSLNHLPSTSVLVQRKIDFERCSDCCHRTVLSAPFTFSGHSGMSMGGDLQKTTREKGRQGSAE
jgi:hypothetical protein